MGSMGLNVPEDFKAPTNKKEEKGFIRKLMKWTRPSKMLKDALVQRVKNILERMRGGDRDAITELQEMVDTNQVGVDEEGNVSVLGE